MKINFKEKIKMNTFDTICSRKSVRSYTGESITYVCV